MMDCWNLLVFRIDRNVSQSLSTRSTALKSCQMKFVPEYDPNNHFVRIVKMPDLLS